MGQRAVCFSPEICVCLKISTADRTHARTLCANRNRHTTSSSTFCRVSVQSQKASFRGLVPESHQSPTARQFFCDDTAALPCWGYFFSSSFFRTCSARHSVRELDARAHVLTSSLFLPSSVHDVAPRPRSLRRCRFRYASPARGGACACSRDEPAASVAAHHGGSGWWLR